MRWVLVVLFASCADPPLPDQLIESKHIRYHYWADAGAPCPEALEEMDRFIELLGAKVNRPAPADFRIDYYRVRNLEDVRAFCDTRAGACAIENRVYAPEWTHDHELTHAFLNHLETPPQLFHEGAAIMFGCGPARWSGAPLASVDLEPLVDNDAWERGRNESNSAAAGSFSRWLVDRHGLETYVRFFESTPYRSTRAELNANFRASFGVELSDALAEWHAGPPSREGEICIPLEDRCDGAPDLQVTAAGMRQALTAPVSCVNHVSVLEVGDVPVTGVRFTASQPNRILQLRPCDSTGGPALQLNHTFFGAGTTNLMDGRWQDAWSTLKPGRYSLTVENTQPAYPNDVLSPPGGTLSIEVEGRGPVLGESCAVAPIPVPDDSWAVRVFLESAAVDAGVIRFEPVSERRIVAFAGGGFEEPVSLCSECSTTCTQVSRGQYPGWLRGPTSLQLQPSDGGALSVHLTFEAP